MNVKDKKMSIFRESDCAVKTNYMMGGLLNTKPLDYLYSLDVKWVSILQVLFGSVLLSILAQLAIPLPFTPVPITMQTLGIATLAMMLGPKKGALAVVAYLVQATMGLPVLAGGLSNPLWMIGPKAGYLVGFVVSAYVLGKALEKNESRSFLKSWSIFSLNELIIVSLGTLWLGAFVGWSQALVLGAVPFIPVAFLKITIATSLYQSGRSS